MFKLATYEVEIFTLFMYFHFHFFLIYKSPAGQMPTFLSAWINR